MKTIEEHNQEVKKYYDRQYQTGVECPKCHQELYYADDFILTSTPPQKRVLCKNCDYRDYIFVINNDC